MKLEFFYQEQVGRLLNASVLLSINEVELSIYRFLSSGAKNSKREPRPGRDEPQPGRGSYWEREKILGIPRLDKGNQLTGSPTG